jgi:hypothetical protein
MSEAATIQAPARKKMKFRLLHGGHAEGGFDTLKLYKPGDTIESDVDLCKPPYNLPRSVKYERVYDEGETTSPAKPALDDFDQKSKVELIAFIKEENEARPKDQQLEFDPAWNKVQLAEFLRKRTPYRASEK